MEARIYLFGALILKGGKVIEKVLFSPSQAAEFFLNYEAKLRELMEELGKRGIQVEEVKKSFSEEGLELAIDLGIFKGKQEFRRFRQQFFFELCKLKMKAMPFEDKIIINLINGLDELNKVINTLMERIVELYGNFFPEAIHAAGDYERMVRLIAMDPHREFIAAQLKLSSESMGSEFGEEDLRIIKVYAKRAVDLINLKNEITAHLEAKMNKIAPNLSKVATPLIGAKLIAAAGSLEALAKLPASTIQLFGAEKALFRHLRKGAKPPKHGYILAHPLLKGAPVKDRGRIARTLASKIAIAAKIDVYGKEDRSEVLLKELEERMRRIKGEGGKK